MNVRFAIIGFGAIADEIVRTLQEQSELGSLVAILVRPEHLSEAKRKAAGRFNVVDDVESLLNTRLDIVAECAGHGAMRQFAPTVLAHGFDLLCSSVGALADSSFAREISGAASHAELWIPSGAIAGIDGLLASRTAGLERVSYTSIKAPVAWKETAAEAMLAGAAGARRTVFFDGSAREAAIAYPKNVNVGATVALAGLGLDRTNVKLVSDPMADGPLGVVEARGTFGTFRFETLAYASSKNPKTSILTAHSIIAALEHGIRFPALPMLKERLG